MGSVSRKTDSLMSFFFAPRFSGWIPIWSMGALQVYLFAPVFKPTREGAQGGAPCDIQGAPVAQRRWCKFLVLNFIGIPRKPSYSAPFLSYYFLAEFPSGAWVPTKPINFAWASKIGWGDLSASSPSGEREDACGLCRWWLVSHVNQVIQPLFLC